MKLPLALQEKLNKRIATNALRQLTTQSISRIDFSSNDYLGFAQSETIFNQAHQYLLDNNIKSNGATGSRLISGNHSLYNDAENYIAQFHNSESALIFNSGYDANVGFFSAIPQRNDIILYDELCHASIRDGIQMSNAKSFKFSHNNIHDLEEKIIKLKAHSGTIYIATESIFSMDGDVPNLEKMIQVVEKHNCYLIVDEAHALGVFGEKGEGLIQSLGFQDKVFARIMTFGKGLGCHGAAILGSQDLRTYLVNFSRSFIYTTGLSPHSVATILVAYKELVSNSTVLKQLNDNIHFFNQIKSELKLSDVFVQSNSAIQCAIIPGNEKVKSIAKSLQEKGFDVKPILSPTVSEGQERLRFCLHSFNKKEEITQVLFLLSTIMNNE